MYVTMYPRQTRHSAPQSNDLSFEQLLQSGALTTLPEIQPPSQTYPTTITLDLPYEYLRNYMSAGNRFAIAQTAMTRIDIALRDINLEDLPNQYNTFTIPKRSGGLRRIDAPHDELKLKLSAIKSIIENQMKVLPHNAAHAYTKQRCIITAMQVHQKNESRWFLKLDLKDFFPSHNYNYIMHMLSQIYPFGVLMRNETILPTIQKMVTAGLLNDGLPQGTPLSPTLTNILMMPIDEEIRKALPGMVYTRYADDLLISNQYTFDKNEVTRKITNILLNFETPFRINAEKTRYGSSAGRNWNLGVMLNKDNQLTIGHKQNQRFRAMIFNFLKDLTNGKTWNRMDVQTLQGLISYYNMIEPDYVQEVLKRYSDKFSKNVHAEMRRILNMPLTNE